MNWQFNKKNTTYAVYACGIILFTIACIALFINKDAGAGILDTVSGILMPIFVGIVVAYLLNPILRLFERLFNKMFRGKAGKGVLRALGLIATYILFLGLVTAFMALLIPQIYGSVGEMVNRVMELVNSIPLYIQDLIDKNDSFADLYEMLATNFDLSGMMGEITGNLDSILNSVVSFTKSMVSFFSNALLGMFFSVYFLASKETLIMQVKKFFLAFFSFKNNVRLGHFMTTVDTKFGQFIRGKLLDSTLVMIIVYILTWIFGMPYYPMIALIIGVTDLIPVFGPFLGAIPSAIIIFLAEEGGFRKALLFALIILIVQQIDGNIIAPNILGDRVGISGVWIMVAVVVMGGIFGIFGMFFGVPAFAVVYTLVQEAVDKRLTKKGLAEQFEIDEDNNRPPKPSLFTRVRNRLFRKKKEDTPKDAEDSTAGTDSAC